MNAATILDTVMVVDKTKLSAEILEAIATNKVQLSASNGNLYWSAGSGRTGVAAQLPLRAATPDERAGIEQMLKLGQSVKSAQAAAMAATAVSTVIVVGVVIAATAYLSARIDRVGMAVADIAEGQDLQDRREYARDLSALSASVEQARDLLKPSLPLAEVASRADHSLTHLSTQRKQALAFVSRLCAQLDEHGGRNATRYAQALAYMAETLDWIPVSLSIEQDLLLLAGKPELAQQHGFDGATDFRTALAQFRTWCEAQYRQVAEGRSGFVDTLVAQRPRLRGLMTSDIHAFLLAGLEGRSTFSALLRKDSTDQAEQIAQAQTAATSSTFK